jgi:ABC-type multidrug transport system fused ATPase/permease subunit
MSGRTSAIFPQLRIGSCRSTHSVGCTASAWRKKRQTILTFGFLLCFALALKKAFQTIRPIFRERGKINAEVTGRLAESLGGIRVVKGYHAETREEKVFSVGVLRLLENVMQPTPPLP